MKANQQHTAGHTAKEQKSKSGQKDKKDQKVQEIIALEKEYWSLLEKGNMETAFKLNDFPTLLVSQRGVRATSEEEYRANCDTMKDAKMKIHDLKNFQARRLDEDTACVIYEAKFDLTSPKNGTENYSVACASTWSKRSGQWKCAMHVETPLKETNH